MNEFQSIFSRHGTYQILRAFTGATRTLIVMYSVKFRNIDQLLKNRQVAYSQI